MPPLDKDEQPRYKNALVTTFAVIGFIIICICINAALSPGSVTPPDPDIISNNPTTLPTQLPTTNPPTPIITVRPQQTPTSFIYLNYSLNSIAYRMGIPKDDVLENIYVTHETNYVCTKYVTDKSPCSNEEFQLYYTNYVLDPSQDGAMDNIITTIKRQTANPDDQARIAISMVQQIPYDSDKSKQLTENTKVRYPYQVIYENKGICSEKLLLLAALLRKLDFGVVLFHFEPEKHMTIGIRSPAQYAYVNSGYAFVETTSPSIPTDAMGQYTQPQQQLTSIPIVYLINEGRSMDSISHEYNDNIRLKQIEAMGKELPEEYYYEWKNFTIEYNLRYT